MACMAVFYQNNSNFIDYLLILCMHSCMYAFMHACMLNEVQFKTNGYVWHNHKILACSLTHVQLQWGLALCFNTAMICDILAGGWCECITGRHSSVHIIMHAVIIIANYYEVLANTDNYYQWPYKNTCVHVAVGHEQPAANTCMLITKLDK